MTSPDPYNEKHDQLLTEPRVQRIVSLFGQFGLRPGDCARLLRQIAAWYESSSLRLCEECGAPLEKKRRQARYCSPACKQKAYRRKKLA